MTPTNTLIPDIFAIWVKNPFFIGGTFVVLILSDHFLTRKGFSLAQKRYRKYFKSEIFELNPAVQNTIHEEKPLDRNLRMRSMIVVGTIVGISIIYQYSQEYFLVEFTFKVGLGYLFWTFIVVNLIHIKSIILSRNVNINPDMLEGEITTSSTFDYKTTAQYVFTLGWLGVITFVLTWEPFFLGLFVQSIVNRRSLSKWDEETRSNRSSLGEISDN